MSQTPTHIRIPMLHITNGHSVPLDQAGLPGPIVYWVDVLHEGPVPAGLSLDELSQLTRISLICLDQTLGKLRPDMARTGRTNV